MHRQEFIHSLERFEHVLPHLVRGLSVHDAEWRPDPASWSIKEIVGHLGDEEVEDFRPRLASTLDDPSRPWPPIDPERAVAERKHQDQELDELLDRFLAARRESVAWLLHLEVVDWSRAYEHPHLGPLDVGDLLASWAAHDLLHLRQITRRLHGLCGLHAGDHDTAYAGPWA